MSYQDVWRRIERRALWSTLNAQRSLQLAPRAQHGLQQIGYMRLIQNMRETGVRRNPDDLVGHFFSAIERKLAMIEDLAAFHARPVYHYVLTRTRHYDRVLQEALDDGVTQLVFFGVGADTRSFRFREALDAAGVNVIETELEPWLSARIERCRGLAPPKAFRQIEFVLGETDPGAWIEASGYDPSRKTVFMAEGVTPYITPDACRSMLDFAAAHAPAGSRLAFDGKYEDKGDANAGGRFRMPHGAPDIAPLKLLRLIPSADAQRELAPYDAPLYDQDVFVVAEVE